MGNATSKASLGIGWAEELVGKARQERCRIGNGLIKERSGWDGSVRGGCGYKGTARSFFPTHTKHAQAVWRERERERERER